MPIPFSQRHIGPNEKQIKEMLSFLGFSTFFERTYRLYVRTIPNFIIKNMIHNKKYGNYAADSAAKFFMEKMMQLIQLHVSHSGGGRLGPVGPGPPRMKTCG